MNGSSNPNPVFDVFNDFKRRRGAIIRALTTDFEEFRERCDPEKEELCLYGQPSRKWDVKPPEEDVPPDLPEPFSFIHYGREDMQEKDWLSYIAVYCDAWLISVAFFKASIKRFDKDARERLFILMNKLPTVSETVKNADDKRQSDHNKEMMSNSQPETSVAGNPQDKCGICKQESKEDVEEFWICCDTCDTWFHGDCVKITPPMAKFIKYYKCPTCFKDNKKAPA